MPDQSEFLQLIMNLSKYHREHEKFYAQSPMEAALRLQRASRILKTLADHWMPIQTVTPKQGNPFLGCEDLNVTSTIQEIGVLFMEGEGEPAEISQLKRDLELMAGDFGKTGEWLGSAMQSSWDMALFLVPNPALACVLGERHRIIANDWLAASMSSLVSRLITRAVDILKVIDFSPAAVRTDLLGPKNDPPYLYSAAELLDRAADMASESAMLVHDNERRWRIFRHRVSEVLEGAG